MLIMVSITLSIPEEIRKVMKESPEVNWSHLVRQAIIEKASILTLKKQMLEQLNSKEEQELINWSVELGRKSKQGRFKELVSKSQSKKKELLIPK